MPKESPRHALVTLRNVMGLSQNELALTLLPEWPHRAAKIIGGCQNGTSSLRTYPSALQRLVEIFGLHPGCVLPYKRGWVNDGTLSDLAGGGYSPIWFLAWIFTADETPLKECGESDQSGAVKLVLARRVARASDLQRRFLEENDPLLVTYATWSDYSQSIGIIEPGTRWEWEPHTYPWMKGLLEVLDARTKERTLFGNRHFLAAKLFNEVASKASWAPHTPNRLRELLDLGAHFKLPAIFEMAGYRA